MYPVLENKSFYVCGVYVGGTEREREIESMVKQYQM